MSIRRKGVRHLKRKKNTEMELDINSLLDILVILLVFLLKSYSASELEVSLPDNMKIPDSVSRDYGNQAPVVKVTKAGKVYLGKEVITNNILAGLDKEGKLVELYNKLVKIREQKKIANAKLKGRSPASAKDKDDFTVNLVFDKDLAYSKMKVVMHTTGSAGFNKFKFLVQAVE